MTATWREVKDKYVIESNGVYKAFTKKELVDLKKVIADIESGNVEFKKYDNR